MHPRHRIDIGRRDLAFALLSCARRHDRERLAERIERLVSPPHDAIACLSVRSGFDLLLGALALPQGSEVVVSAITHPDMVGILELHGLRPVPADLELDTLAPRPDAVEAAVAPATKAILVAPLFGSGIEIAPLASLARKAGLLLIEDCAQALREPRLRADEHADVSLFSFGPIKTATALGGGVVRVRDASLRARMRERMQTWPVQPTRELVARALKFGALSFLAHPQLFRVFVRACERRGRDLDELLSSFVRGFNVPYDDPRFAARIRRRPSGPLLALLERRLERFDRGRLARGAALGERLAGALPEGFFHPGRDGPARTHWVFPLVAADPPALIAALRERGFDAAPPHATSAITVVPAPPERQELDPVCARWLMEHVVFLPAYPELGERALERLLAALRDAAALAPPVPPPAPAPVPTPVS
jgi:perosamine synthetase